KGTLEHLMDIPSSLAAWMRLFAGPGQDADTGRVQNDLLAGIASWYSGMPVTTAGPDGVYPRSVPGAAPGGLYGPQGAGLADPYALVFDRSLRRYLGVS